MPGGYVVRGSVLASAFRFLTAIPQGPLSILLAARRPQPPETVAFNRTLPGKKFFDRQRITAAGIFKRKKPSYDCSNDFCLSANHPAVCARLRQIGNRQRIAVGPYHEFHALMSCTAY
jgi:hypothetical protein